MRKPTRPRNTLTLLIAVAGWALCGTSHADTIIGGPSAGFQSWTAADLNNNGAPYWDVITNYPFPPGNQGNVGHCLTDGCAGQLSPGPPPGSIPFWGLSYNSVTDTGGGLDPNFFFQRAAPETLRATLEVSLATDPTETNSFGWFETDSFGTTRGPTHQLFDRFDPLGIVTTFQPTQWFGYYFHDFSEGCDVFTLSSFNTGVCGPALFHDLAAFATDPSSPLTSFWMAGLNAVRECAPPGNDCNLTLVKVDPVPEPMTALMLATGCAGLLFAYRKHRRRERADKFG
jgi:hypothetical protein